MKTQKFLLSGIFGIALAGLVLNGCKKDSTTPTSNSTDTTAAQDEANASSAMNDTKNVSDAGMEGNSSNYTPEHSIQSIYTTHCTVSWSTNDTAAADTMYINFGSTPVECNDLRWRQGEIIVYWNRSSGNTLWQSYFDSASTINMTFKNYAVGSLQTNMIGVSGTRSWTNTGHNALAQENWSFTAGLTLTYPDGQTATWNSTRTNTLVPSGGVYYYEITGYAAGKSKSGLDYTVTINNPLYFTAKPWWNGGCHYIEAGTISININTSPASTITIDFGTLGSCDASATATLNGHTYTISLL